MKFIHTGDIHWGMSPDSDKPWSRERARDIRDTFAAIIEKTKTMGADCLFIAGDLFHRQPLLKDLKEVNYLFSTIPRVKVVMIAGNHDRIRSSSAVLSFTWSPNVTFLSGVRLFPVFFPVLLFYFIRWAAPAQQQKSPKNGQSAKRIVRFSFRILFSFSFPPSPHRRSLLSSSEYGSFYYYQIGRAHV